jgi:hypothetical protein
MTEFLLNMGIAPEDFPQVLEILGILALCLGVVLFIVKPLVHFTFLILPDSNTPPPTGHTPVLPTVAEYLKVLRTTLKQWLKRGFIGGVGSAALYFVISSPYCSAHFQTCLVWAEAIVSALMILSGIVISASFARRLYQQGWKNNIFYIFLNLMLIYGFGSFTVNTDWNTLFGGNCTQSARQPRSDLSLIAENPDPPFPIGSDVRLQRGDFTLDPQETGYCIPVQAAVGSRATVQAFVPRRNGSGYTMDVLWHEQSFQELSWIGLVLERHVQLQPFTSALSPDDVVR